MVTVLVSNSNKEVHLELIKSPECITDDHKTQNLKTNTQCPMKLEIIYGKCGK